MLAGISTGCSESKGVCLYKTLVHETHLYKVLESFLVFHGDEFPQSLMAAEAVRPEVWDLLYDLVAFLVQWLPLQIVLLFHLKHFLAGFIIHLCKRTTVF